MMLDTKKILQANLIALLKTRTDISRLDLSRLMGVADGTLGRIKYGNGNPTVEVIEQIAKFFKVQPWQLLHENLGRDRPRENISPAVADIGVNIHLFESLSEEDKKEIAELVEFKAERWKRQSVKARHDAG